MSGGGGAMQVGVSSRHGGRFTQKAKGRQLASTGLMLTSMLDIMTTILFFLMKNYSTVKSDFNIGKDLSLPYSSSLQPTVPSIQLIVAKSAILLDNETVVTLVNGEIDKKDLYKDGITIVKLAQMLKAHKDRSLFIQKQDDQQSFTGSIVMQADKSLPYSVLKKVIFTAGISDFSNFRLAVLKKDG